MLRKFLILQAQRFSTNHRLYSNNLNLTKIPDPYALDLSNIAKAVSAVPSLSSTPINLWETIYAVFRDHGVKAQKFIEIVIHNPMFLSRPAHKITKGFETWRSCQFGETNCLQLLLKYPQLLFISEEKELVSQITYLRKYVQTTKNCYLLILNSPNVITERRKMLDKKFEYFFDTMRIDIPEIVKSRAMSRTFEHIEIRHTFLCRLGLFKPRSLKSDLNIPTNNHRLYQITDTDDETFAQDICHVTLSEYATFKQLYIREMNKREQTIGDDHDDDFKNDIENEKETV